MSVEGDLFRVTVKGSRESIIKMMNAALKILAHLYPNHYGVDWEQYHSKHPEVEISEDEWLAWFNEQKQPWDQEEDWHYWCAMVSITDDCLISFKVDRE